MRIVFVVMFSLSAAGARAAAPASVECEEVVTTYAPANNGAGPLWCYGSTVIARDGDDVFVSIIETGRNVPPLCNTRWQLWRRTPVGWRVQQSEREYRQREPCPLALFPGGALFLSVNPSTRPPGTQYGPCLPLILEFDSRRPGAAPRESRPGWSPGAEFTDHSYRGLAADGARRELLLLNINAASGAYFVSFRDDAGRWHPRGTIEFPIRACYPQVALRRRAAHVLAIGDIVEPNPEWRRLKAETLKREWDYVFRRLFYTYTPDIAGQPFVAPVEVDSVEKTGGHITNLDLHVDASGAAHILYLRRPHQYDFLRDRFFPGEPLTAHLEYARLREGTVVARATLASTGPAPGGVDPSYGRFIVGEGEQLFVIAAGTAPDEADQPAFGNFLARAPDERGSRPRFQRVPLARPLHAFFTATPRAGTSPSSRADLLGVSADDPKLRYAALRLAH